MTGAAGPVPVRVDRDGEVRTLTLDRPEKRNAITTAMYATLADEFEAAESAGGRVVVLTGAGGAFTAGNDLGDMRANPRVGDDPPPVRFLRAIASASAVVIAAVDGPALGIGSTVLLHCDLVYATARSLFGFPFVDLGLVPEAASTLLLPRSAGRHVAAEMMLFGEKFDATTARTAGLVTEVVADAAALEARLAERVAGLLGKPPVALRAVKRLLADESALTVPERLAMDSQVLRELAERMGDADG